MQKSLRSEEPISEVFWNLSIFARKIPALSVTAARRVLKTMACGRLLKHSVMLR